MSLNLFGGKLLTTSHQKNYTSVLPALTTHPLTKKKTWELSLTLFTVQCCTYDDIY